MPQPVRKKNGDSTANLGFEAKLWAAADALRNNMDAAEYKHVVLGLIFLKYISDAFEAKHAELDAQKKQGADPEDPDEYRAVSIFWVPKEARWQHLKAKAPQPTIGTTVDDAMSAIERDNPALKGVLPKDYARPGLDKQRLGQLINLVSDIELAGPGHRAVDRLGRVFEYFLSQFASAEGKKGGQFYTPSHVVRVLVEVLAPYKGRVYDPCCGSGGMFVQSEKFIEAHAGKIGDISIYGQESNYTTWRLAAMNLAIRGIDAQIAHGDAFHNDRHPDLKADYVLANPPFNDSDWRGELLKNDQRWAHGVPPAGNANFAWVQHFIHHLAPTGLAGFVLANGSMSSNQSGEGEIRKNLVEADLVDCMVALPGQLFYSTQIPVKGATKDGKMIGSVARVPPSVPSGRLTQDTVKLEFRDASANDRSYLYWILRTPQYREYCAGRATGSAVVALSRRDFLSFPVPPEVPQRRTAVDLLDALEEKIELNRRMSETLEAMARALFKSWFVDFDLVRAAVADLIREGVLEIGDGYRAKNSEMGVPGLPFVRAGNLSDGFDTSGAEVLHESSVAIAGNKRSRAGDVAFTSKGTIGRFARVTEFTPGFVYSPQVCFWRSLDRGRLEPAVLYCWMQSEDLKSQIDAVAGQTDMALYVSLRDQRAMEVPLFPESQHAVAQRLDVLLARQALVTEENRTLAALRDALLPKLISGELRIPDAEAAIKVHA